MKQLVTALIITISGLNAYCSDWDALAYPYLRVNSNELESPKSIDDCFHQLNMALKLSIIEHFKNGDEYIETIKITNSLGSAFANHWRLYYHLKTDKYDVKLSDKRPFLIEYFSELGMENPYLIMNIIFKCYHKELNDEYYNIKEVVDIFNNEFQPSEFNPKTLGHYGSTRKLIELKHDSIINAVNKSHFSIEDTIGRRFYEDKRESVFYITGKIFSVNTDNNELDIKILDIVSDKRYLNVHFDSDIIVIGDSVKGHSENWKCYNKTDFSYRNGEYQLSMPSWNEYIKAKFDEK